MERYWEGSRLHFSSGFSFPPSILFFTRKLKNAVATCPHIRIPVNK